MRVDDVWAFARERHMTHLRRAAGGRPPWTDDPIIRQFRFCNVYRELDAVTCWIRENWREPNADDPDLWFAMAVARHLNVPECLADVGYPVPWRPAEFCRVVELRRAAGAPLFSAAYMIGTRERMPKAVYVAERVLTPLWDRRAHVRYRRGELLAEFHERLSAEYGFASFLAAQVVADAKYHGAMRDAEDWHLFVEPGPGSLRGMARVLGRDIEERRPPRVQGWRNHLLDLRGRLAPLFEEQGWPVPHAQDVQNLLCEFDKYERVRLGQGRPKQLFRSGGN